MTDVASEQLTVNLERWQSLHLEGLRRVSTILDGNPNYDTLLEYRLSQQDRASFDDDTPLEVKRERACEHIRLHLVTKGHKIILPQFSGFVSEGSTPNNDREYLFFERICSSLDIRVQDQNYSKTATIGMGKRSVAEEALLQAVLYSAEHYYRKREVISAGLVRQLTLFSVSFFRFVVAFHRKGATRPGVLVQANDHSPVRVAMAMVMKGLGVPRIYLQHAEVTTSFPPLDFEYSVLRNHRSKAVYESLGPLTGNVFVLPRYEDSFAGERLQKELEEPVTTVIYPTSRVVLDELKSVIAALGRNPDVAKIVIKQHPAAAQQLHDVLAGMEVDFAKSIPDEQHLALVGNSAVVAELLHMGVPVYQNFRFDPVSADYYGFVSQGLTKEVATEELSDRFWHPYVLDANWLRTFKELDPTVDTAYQAEQHLLLSEMQRLKASLTAQKPVRKMRGSVRARVKARTKRSLVALINASPWLSGPVLDAALSSSARLGNFLTFYSYLGANYLRNRTNIPVKSGRWNSKPVGGTRMNPSSAVSLLEQTLCDLPNPVSWLKENERLGVFGDEVVIRALENMFQDRRVELSGIFEGHASWSQGSPVGTWIYLKRLEWSNAVPDKAEMDQLSLFIHGLGSEQPAKPILERLLLIILLRCGTIEQLERFWQQSTSVTPDALGTNTRINLLQRLYSEHSNVAQAEEMRRQFEAISSPFELLKLRNMDYLSGRAAAGWSHATAEQQFEHLAPNGVAREFRSVALPFYERFRSKMVLMEVRTEPTQSLGALEQIRRALEEKRPFSLVRLSDGEGYLFPGHEHFTESDARNRERHWWNIELPQKTSSKIISEAQLAVAAADMIGIPSVYRFIRDTGDTTRALSQSLQGRGLLQVLAGLPQFLGDSVQLSEDKINVSLFSSLGNVLNLATSAQRTVVVGSAKREHLPHALLELAGVLTVEIPTHARTTHNSRYVLNSAALPFVYDAVLQELDAVGPGDLVLVAGGIVGKILLGYARTKGAVALDIGSVLDDWVSSGRKSLR